MHRTHTCGELRKSNADKKVILSGWVSKPRDHGGVIFIDLRDRYGLTQVVFNPDIKDFKEAEKLRREDVIKIEGIVKPRWRNCEARGQESEVWTTPSCPHPLVAGC